VIVDAILTTGLNDQITVLHAGKGVKTPPVAPEGDADHHRDPVRRDLRRPAGPGDAVAGGDRHRIGPAVG
jgi:hypothetical protein